MKTHTLIKENDLTKLIISCWVSLFAIWLYVIISGNYLTIVANNEKLIQICNYIDNNIILENLVSFIMYFLNWIFVLYAIIQQKLFKYKPILIVFMIIGFWLIKAIFENYQIVNFIDFIYFGLIAIWCKKKWYRSVIGAVLTFIFALISSFIKQLFVFDVNFNNVPILITLIFSIDIYLMSFIYYLIAIHRKEGNHGQKINFLQIRKNLENYFCSIRDSISSVFNRNNRNSSLKEKFYEKYCAIVFFLITYGSLLIIGIIFNRWIEMSISVVFFHIFRGEETDTYHARNDLICWSISMLNFCIVMKLTLPIYISYIFSILLSFVLCVIMRIVYLLFKPEKVKNKKEKLKQIIGYDKIKDEEYIEKLCLEIGLSEKYSETIFLYLNNTAEETASILEIDVKTVRRRIDKFIEKAI